MFFLPQVDSTSLANCLFSLQRMDNSSSEVCVLLSVIDSLLAAIVDSGLDLSPLVCANTLYGLQVQYTALQCSTVHRAPLYQSTFFHAKRSFYQICYLSMSSDFNNFSLLTLLYNFHFISGLLELQHC